MHRGRDRGDLVIEMRPGAHPSAKYRKGDKHPLPVPDLVIDPHPVVAALRDDDGRLPESPGNRGRAVMIAQAIAEEATRRDIGVRGGGDGFLMEIVVGDLTYRLRVTEETSARWMLRLVLDLAGPGLDVPRRWTDRAKRRVEDDLGQVLEEIVGHADTTQRRIAEREGAEARRLADMQEKALRTYRAKVLGKQVEAWCQAHRIRRHCDELVAAGMHSDDTWVQWARARADEIDPLLDPPGLPDPANADDISEDEPAHFVPSPFARVRREVPKSWHPKRRWWDR